ncbi:hypothetical protein QBC34DRAFT_145141 [Podospora aff. communis PSN243]|uniref:Uncharacterized protein n=1 Tax=Podospora aff. communis PSN243 TaxID=3040156 RepID=A0AAV9GHI7_9PEZI|nr:hypothetical protein QBC34DRAFT_145141 [Podospora aff. communis PSN243]
MTLRIEDAKALGQTVWTYDDSDFADLGLTLIEVSPERSWGADRQTIASPTAFLRFRHDDSHREDFVVLLEVLQTGERREPRCSVSTCFRNAQLKRVIDQLTIDADDWAFWSTKASNGAFHLEITLQRIGPSIINITPDAAPGSPLTSVTSVSDSDISVSDSDEEAEGEEEGVEEDPSSSDTDDNASDTSDDSTASSSSPTAPEQLLRGPWFQHYSSPLYAYSCIYLRVVSLLGPNPTPQFSHEITPKSAQTITSHPTPTPAGFETRRESYMCQTCRHHFAFAASFTASTLCRPGHHDFVLQSSQHLTLEGRIPEIPPTPLPTTPSPLVAASFVCSRCDISCQLVISPPRLPSSDLLVIIDQDRIAAKLQEVKQTQPERYEHFTPIDEARLISTPLLTLRTYINDTWRGQRRRISWRNKTFQVQFGEACEGVFERLGFTKEEDEDESMYWALPVVEGPGYDAVETRRRWAFYEDVLHELVAVMRTVPAPRLGLIT